jgi:hypothetical protein
MVNSEGSTEEFNEKLLIVQKHKVKLKCFRNGDNADDTICKHENALQTITRLKAQIYF